MHDEILGGVVSHSLDPHRDLKKIAFYYGCVIVFSYLKKFMANILYAEDDEGLREGCRTMLVDIRGHQVTAVGDGALAIEALQTGGVFDVLLTDGNMPGAHGLKVIEAAQKLEQPPGVIILYTADKVTAVPPGVIVLNKYTDSASKICRTIHEALGIALHPADQR